MKTKLKKLNILFFIPILLITGCTNSKIVSPVIEGIKEIYPKTQGVKVIYKSLIRVAGKQLDTLDEYQIGDIADMLDKIYMYSSNSLSAEQNGKLASEIDSIVEHLKYEPVIEADYEGEYYFMSYISDKEIVDEIFIYTKNDHEINVIHIFGKIDVTLISKVIPAITKLSNISVPFL